MTNPVKGGKFTYFSTNIDNKTTKQVKDMNIKITAPKPNESSAEIKDGESTEKRRTTGGKDMTTGFRFTERQKTIFEHICKLDGNPDDLSQTDLDKLKSQKGLVKIDKSNMYKVNAEDNGNITITLYDDRTKPDEDGANINFEIIG